MLQADDVTLAYGATPVVHGVSLALEPGGVGLIGESGSGKTTLARALLGLLRPRSGRILYGTRDLAAMRRTELAAFRAAVQPVFQDGSEALNPRMRIGSSVAEALSTHHRLGRAARQARVAELLESVGLAPDLARRRPHEVSGGQRQRAVIARALAVRPGTLVLDEPTSALDVTVQARVLDLLEALTEAHGLNYLLITHNLAVVHRLCRTSHVMFAGRVVESGPTADLLARPAHPYTAALRDAVPRIGGPPPGAARDAVSGIGGPPPRDAGPRIGGPSPRAGGSSEAAPAADGCAFRLRCPLAVERCHAERPLTRQVGGRAVACHRAEELLA